MSKNPTTKEPIFNATGRFRVKCGRLQQGFTYRPWVRGSDDPIYLRWIDVALVAADSPDEELWT